MAPRPAPDMTALQATDRPILQALSQGMPLVPQPYQQLATGLWAKPKPISLPAIKALNEAEILTRIGVIVRHRAIGWTSNAMVVWDVAEANWMRLARRLRRCRELACATSASLWPGVWPYALYSMIHARSRAEAMAVLETAKALPELGGSGTFCFVFNALFQTNRRAIDARKGRVMRRSTLPPDALDATDRVILNALQDGFPISPRPFAEAGASLGIAEDVLIDRIINLREIGAITRFGPFYDAAAMGGAFCLCAMEVPADRL